MSRLLQTATLYARALRRGTRRRAPAPLRAFRAPDRRPVFVFGCPRSGTTFLGSALGTLSGYVDLGEVAPLKAALPRLAHLDAPEAGADARRVLGRVERLCMTGGLHVVEQTPECVFIADGLANAYPDCIFIHLVRDGRDVVCSLQERGWLAADRDGEDDAGHAYGADKRFWVEPGLAGEFAHVSDTRRAAWAWRRYVEAGRSIGERAIEVRYEELTRNPAAIAERLAGVLQHDVGELTAALASAHDESVGRYSTDLSPGELADVEAEAAHLLRALGYNAAGEA